MTAHNVEDVEPTGQPSWIAAMMKDYTCALCRYSTLKHIVVNYDVSPSGLMCPIDARAPEQCRLPVKP